MTRQNALVRRLFPAAVVADCLLLAVVSVAQPPKTPRADPLAPPHLKTARTEPGAWPQFLGPERNGVSSERGLIEAWPAGGIKEVWRAGGGVGMSGLAIREERLVTLVQKDFQ